MCNHLGFCDTNIRLPRNMTRQVKSLTLQKRHKNDEHVGIINHSLLFDFLLRGIGSWVKDAFGEMLDQSDSLSDTDLLLLGQLTGQATLPWVGMVHWERLCLFLGNRRHKTPCVAKVCSGSLASQ